MEICFNSMQAGTKAVVSRMEVSQELEKRLSDFGLIPETSVCCRYRSPGGDLAALEVRGAVVAIRSGDLSGIWGRKI